MITGTSNQKEAPMPIEGLLSFSPERRDMDDEKVIVMGCFGLLVILALPGIMLFTLVICKILDNMIPPM